MSKKDLILDVAESLFNQFGYTAVGVDMIRDEAAVSKTSMYRHFGSKTKLIEAVLERRHQRFESSLEAALSSTSGLQNQLDALLDWHLAWFEQPDFKGCMFMHSLAEFKESEDDIAMLSRQHKVWLKNSIRDVVRGNEEVDTAILELRSESVMTFIEGLIVRGEFGQLDSKSDSNRQAYRKALHSLAILAI
ncbi:Transcriptional regulator /TetR family transcriptional regulator [Vibrio crassostreae]|uniref:TetR/AcrR family transcriptional regulator n=1 Tax=Vibrio crassostreae TaxID=246167 RepID=UPI00104E5FE8|nr:TetR/AcrR family transcriptional regulator [Vibrio crassostreae]TCN84759.1 transcriptional regulator /TetR family transcriptional regulator [Vibrio crassostreae]CAK2413419.1 Transcriptional regulator /TetR family transcriptional regulator [Vibrio crassostreae]CAK2443764.1 Transcriptional regulator /TetR family transcriptional regulator [Vibrio crassostreae]CAK3714680.1 Transcriptional regulator /TetR family transcriptional regulator [Vibrio crassostreae]CAK3783877.1 Transcriptional regulato